MRVSSYMYIYICYNRIIFIHSLVNFHSHDRRDIFTCDVLRVEELYTQGFLGHNRDYMMISQRNRAVGHKASQSIHSVSVRSSQY